MLLSLSIGGVFVALCGRAPFTGFRTLAFGFQCCVQLCLSRVTDLSHVCCQCREKWSFLVLSPCSSSFGFGLQWIAALWFGGRLIGSVWFGCLWMRCAFVFLMLSRSCGQHQRTQNRSHYPLGSRCGSRPTRTVRELTKGLGDWRVWPPKAWRRAQWKRGGPVA